MFQDFRNQNVFPRIDRVRVDAQADASNPDVAELIRVVQRVGVVDDGSTGAANDFRIVRGRPELLPGV